jgi:hypothetical protein
MPAIPGDLANFCLLLDSVESVSRGTGFARLLARSTRNYPTGVLTGFFRCNTGAGFNLCYYQSICMYFTANTTD